MSLVEVTAPMSGRVLQNVAAVGDTVTSGSELLIFESMKMEVPITSDRTGRVVEFLVIEGGSVKEGDALVRLETFG